MTLPTPAGHPPDLIEALRISEARYRLVAESARDVVWTMAPDGRVTHVSPAIMQVRGYTPEEAMAHTIDETLTPDSAARSTAYFIGMLEAIAQGKRPEPFRGDFEYKCKDGSTYWTEVMAFPVLDAQGQLVELVGVTRDMSDRRALEAERRETQRMESMGRMAAGVAHQINNVLAIIQGAVEASASGELPEPNPIILQSVERAASLTAQLLAFSRLQHITPEQVKLSDLLATSHERLARAVAPSATVEVSYADTSVDAVVDADHASFEQVLLHLVTNARDAMPTGGVIRIRCATTTLSEPLATTRTGKIPVGDYVTIAVEDEGVGMASEVIAQLFEPFFTTKPLDKGTGLGLSTVFGILKQHGAGITVESQPGKGSRFTVYWPTQGNAAVVGAKAITTPPTRLAGRTGQPLVLIVDDEPILLELTRKVVGRLGCAVLTAASSPEALQIARDRRDDLDLLLTDVRMPGMTGTELVEALIKEGIDPPVLFVSGQIDAPIPTDWPATVPRRFLAKPFKLRQLAQEMVELGVLAEPTTVYSGDPGIDQP